VDWFIDRDTMKDDSTLTIIVCYSGWSVEPCLFFETM
jgi:glucose/mannose-6-phosphate isomerase